MPVGPALMEEVERMNIVMVCLNQQVILVLHNPYVIEVKCGNRNYYNYRGFGYLARNYRNRGIGGRIGEGRRLEYKENNGLYNNNLNRNRDLIVYN